MARQNPVSKFEKMVMSIFQATRPQCENDSYYTTGTQKKMIASVMMVIATVVFEAMVFNFSFCPCKEARANLIGDGIKPGTKKREIDEPRKNYFRKI